MSRIMRFTTRHEFACTPEAFFSTAIYFHPAYHEGLYRELRFREVQVLERHEEGDRLREVRIKRPIRDLPGPVKRALGVEAVEYREEALYDRRALTYEFRVFPNVLPGKIRIAGGYRILPAAPGRCLREVDLEVEVRLFGVGAAVERHILEDLRLSYDTAAAYTRRWIAGLGPSVPVDSAPPGTTES
ncbi:MAG: DUF2505 family protein [Myxococcota bacterium]|jgi:hypothetical protein|nr:DUF2505 family protein [Myxococcota bacterium]